MIVDITTRSAGGHRASWTGWYADGAGPDDRDVFHVEFDRHEDDVTVVIADAVGTILNREPTDLPPLGDVTDLDVLSGMVDQMTRGGNQGGEFTFRYEGLEITVAALGHVWIERLPRDDPPS